MKNIINKLSAFTPIKLTEEELEKIFRGASEESLTEFERLTESSLSEEELADFGKLIGGSVSEEELQKFF